MLRRMNLLDALSTLINPATLEKQNEQIALLTASIEKLTEIITNQIDGSHKTQLVDEAGNVSHSTQDVNGQWHSGVHVIQHNIEISSNSSTSNIDPGEENAFTGEPFVVTGAGILGVMFFSDQNCTITIQQSTDGANWDISDTYEYTNYIANFSAPSQVFGNYARVKVVNNGDSTTSSFRLLTILQPIGAVLPRALCRNGCLRVTVNGTTDQYGFVAENTPTGEQRVSNFSVLVGAPFEGSGLDDKFWSNDVVNGGSVSVTSGTANISTGVTANGAAKLWSFRRNQYIPGTSCRFRAIAQFGAGAVNNKMLFGVAHGETMPSLTDGAMFAVVDGQFSIVIYKGGSLEQITSFNGDLGSNYSVSGGELLDFEIYYSVSSLYFSISGKLLHKYIVSGGRWADTAEFHIYAESSNSNGLAANHVINLHSAGIGRFGKITPQHVSDSQSGTTAGKVLKIGVGVLVSVSVSGVANNSRIILYDNISPSGTILWDSGAMGAQSTPNTISFDNIPFNVGLTLVISGASSNVTTVYA